MTRKAVVLIAIVGVFGFVLWGHVSPVRAATSITWVKQDPAQPVHGMAVKVWANFTASNGETPVLEYKINGVSTFTGGVEDYPSGFVANWRFDIPAQVRGMTVNYQLHFRNTDNSLGGSTGFNWTYTVKVLDAIVDTSYDEGTAGFGLTAFNNIQSAVNAVDAGATIRVNPGTYTFSTPILIDKPVSILGIGSDSDVPLVKGKIILKSQSTTLGLIKLFNLRFAVVDGAITIGDAINASFDFVELNQLTFGSPPPLANSKAIQTVNSVQIMDLKILNCFLYAAHGIYLNGDIGSADINNNTFYLTGQADGVFDAITIQQDTKSSSSIDLTGKLTVQGNMLNNTLFETYPYSSAILNQAVFMMTSIDDGKMLNATENTFAGIKDQAQFIKDEIATFVPVNIEPVAVSRTVLTDEDTDLVITLAATDADADELTYSIINGPEHGTFSGTAPLLTYTPITNYNGSDSFTFRANDGTDDSNEAAVTITITAVNDAPATADKSATAAEDTETTITLDATDVDSTNLTFIITNPSNGSAILSDNSVAYTPAANYYGTDSFTFKANDGTEDSNVSTVTVTISAVNDAPTLTAIPAKLVNEGGTLVFTAEASDVDRPEKMLNFSLEDSPTGANINSETGAFSWTPTADQGGKDFTFKVCVSDEVATPTCQNVAVTVSEVNLPPNLNEIPAKIAKEGELLTFTASGNDGDLPTQTLIFSIVNAPTGAAIGSTTGVFTWTPNEGQGGQIYTMSVCITDSAVATPTCQQLTIAVEGVNTSPTMTTIDPQAVNECEPLTFTVTASDTDLPKQALFYSFSGTAPDGMLINTETGEVTWTPSEMQGGLFYFINVCVSDGVVEGPICQDVTVTVNEVNLLPALTEIPAKTVKEGELLTFTAAGRDGDLPKQTLTYSLLNAPTGAVIDPVTGVFTWTPTVDQGDQTFTFKVCVSDGAITTCQDVTINVAALVVPPDEYNIYLPIIAK